MPGSRESLPRIEVAAGVLSNDDGRILIAQRPAGVHMAGWWEFPGGKLDSAERPCDGLVRELREELGIEVTAAAPLLICEHCYPERVVRLHVWRVEAYTGEPRGVEGQALRWLAPDALRDAGLLPADLPIVEALLAPPR